MEMKILSIFVLKTFNIKALEIEAKDSRKAGKIRICFAGIRKFSYVSFRILG
jgi:hypothetical protein